VELIVVDDGGDDNSEVLLKELNDRRIQYFKIANKERGAARNYGLGVATGTYVNFFDSDDIANPCLSNLHQFIIKNNSPDVIYGLIENVTAEGRSIEIIKPICADFKKSLLHNNFLACGSVFVKRELAVKFPFSEDKLLSGTEDWELWLRLYAEHNFIKFPETIFKQRQHTGRSLNVKDAERVRQRETSFICHINENRQLLSKRFSESELNLLIADRHTLIALAQWGSGSRQIAQKHILESLKQSIHVLQRKRFWAVLKKLTFV
jgi:glycosyltransferase involved in cell wall biosynthesis